MNLEQVLEQAEALMRSESRHVTVIMDTNGATLKELPTSLTHSFGDEIYIDNLELKVMKSVTQISGYSSRTVVVVEVPE